jgi:hypothetical protein
MTSKPIEKILFDAYKFYLHFFSLYIRSHEITAEEWKIHKKFEAKIYQMRDK